MPRRVAADCDQTQKLRKKPASMSRSPHSPASTPIPPTSSRSPMVKSASNSHSALPPGRRVGRWPLTTRAPTSLGHTPTTSPRSTCTHRCGYESTTTSKPARAPTSDDRLSDPGTHPLDSRQELVPRRVDRPMDGIIGAIALQHLLQPVVGRHRRPVWPGRQIAERQRIQHLLRWLGERRQSADPALPRLSRRTRMEGDQRTTSSSNPSRRANIAPSTG